MDADGRNHVCWPGSFARIADQVSWSPDGERFAFSAHPVDGQDHVYLMQADGSGVRQLTHGSEASPVWSPDGRRIAFVGYDNAGLSQIYVINADGSRQHVLTNQGWVPQEEKDTAYSAVDDTLAWSPDGRKIAFVGESGCIDRIYVMNADGSDPHALTHK